nr:hypothetical protein Iba_chr07bCG10680 [Ipomoea batatas]
MSLGFGFTKTGTEISCRCFSLASNAMFDALVSTVAHYLEKRRRCDNQSALTGGTCDQARAQVCARTGLDVVLEEDCEGGDVGEWTAHADVLASMPPITSYSPIRKPFSENIRNITEVIFPLPKPSSICGRKLVLYLTMASRTVLLRILLLFLRRLPLKKPVSAALPSPSISRGIPCVSQSGRNPLLGGITNELSHLRSSQFETSMTGNWSHQKRRSMLGLTSSSGG